MAWIKTIEDAYDFVQQVGLCTIFSGKAKGAPALWDAVDLPESGGRTKWGAKVEAVWSWKNALPALYPDDIYYGKIRGGHAALMSMRYLREKHYPENHVPVQRCRELARQVYEIIRLSPATTGEVRCEAMDLHGCTKGRFESALKELQMTLNIVRSNERNLSRDVWVPFGEVYSDF